VNSLGFNEFSVAGKLETATVSGTALSANEIKINDVLIDESLSGSAYHVAATINAKTSEHNVTADAENKVNLDLDFEARPTSATAFKVNGTTVDLRTANNSADFVTAFNNLTIGDLRASSNTDGTVDIASSSGLNIVVSNTDNDFVIGAKDLHGTAINTGLGNGTIDYDGIFDGSSAVGAAVPFSAAIPGGLDLTGGALYNQVVNSTVQITQHAPQDYSAVTWTITGKDADGNTITEALAGIAGTTGTEQDQKRGTQIFHTIDKIVTDAAMTYGYSIGTYSTVATEFDIDSLVTSATIGSAGTLTLNGALATSDLNNSVVTFANTTDHSAAAITFTVTGEDAFGATVTESISYGSDNIQDATVTVHGTQAFHKVTSIHSSAGSTSAMQIGTMQVGDVVEARGNLTLSNSKTTPIKVESVAKDSAALNLAGTGTIMAKMGIQAQGGAFEVQGAGIDVTSLSGANTSLAAIDKAIDKISLFRSSFGAVENRIDASINNLTTLKINTQAAQSRIVDADFASETSRMTKSQILSQAATSMLAQANASKQNLLALLQG
jgi:flagellin